MTMEKMCQSYSSMMFSISSASCWMEAPNWKNVDFTSWTNEEEGRRRRGSKGDLNQLSLLGCSLSQGISEQYKTEYTHKHTHPHVRTYAALKVVRLSSRRYINEGLRIIQLGLNWIGAELHGPGSGDCKLGPL